IFTIDNRRENVHISFVNSDAPSSTRTIEALIRLIETLCAIIGVWSGTGASNARQLARSVQTLRELAEQVRAIHADRTASTISDLPEARVPAQTTPTRPSATRHRHRERSEAIHLSASRIVIAGNPVTRTIHRAARSPP
ncbi:MAG TPA: hypothetical protein VF286_06410, partial [Acidiphilium sp.]